MRILTLALIAATAATTAGCAETYDQPGYASQYSSYRQYDYNRPDPRYRERRLSRNDRVYAGRDGRYYCRRSDGTTGLIVGGIAGGALGAAVTSGRSEPLGILLGAVAGAAAGSAIDKDNVRCR